MVETIGSKWVRKGFDFQFCWKRKAEAKNPEKCYYFFGNNRPNLKKNREMLFYILTICYSMRLTRLTT